MFLCILLAILRSRNIPATAYDNGNLVVIDGRPGCSAHALNGDPAQVVVVCE